MSAISIRLPDSLHRKVKEVAQRDNQVVEKPVFSEKIIVWRDGMM
jgi:predicted transcriptional regulator